MPPALCATPLRLSAARPAGVHPRRTAATARQVMQGKVVSTGAAKTAVVLVERKVMHPLYKKRLTKSKKFHAHDEDEMAKEGDFVRIGSCRPHSKLKRFEVMEGACWTPPEIPTPPTQPPFAAAFPSRAQTPHAHTPESAVCAPSGCESSD